MGKTRCRFKEPYRTLSIYLEILSMKNDGGLREYLRNKKGFPNVQKRYMKKSLDALVKFGVIKYKEVKGEFYISKKKEDISSVVEKLRERNNRYKPSIDYKTGEYSLDYLYKNQELFDAFFFNAAKYNKEKRIVTIS